jgi:hypothetical protein
MANSPAKAREWVERLASHPAVPFGTNLLKHFEAGRITRICDCGCNSFDIEIPAGTSLVPLRQAAPDLKGHTPFFEIVFSSESDAEIDCMLFADSRGYLASVDVMHGQANHLPMPDQVSITGVIHAG